MASITPWKAFRYLFGASIVSQALLFAAIGVIVFRFAPEDFGSFTILTSIATIFSMVSCLKIERAIVVEPDDVIYRIIIFCSICVCVSALICAWILVFIVDRFDQLSEVRPPALIFGAFYCFSTSITQVLAHVAMRTGKTKSIAWADFLFSFLLFIIVLIPSKYANGVNHLMFAWAFSRTLATGAFFFIVPDILKYKYGSGSIQYRSIAKYVKSVGTTLLSSIQFRGIYFLFGLSAGTGPAGHIALAHRVTYSPVNLFGTALRRAYFRAFTNDNDKDSSVSIRRDITLILTGGTVVSVLLFPLLTWVLEDVDALIKSDWSEVIPYILGLYPAASILMILSWLDRVYDAKGYQGLALSLEAIYTLTLYTTLVVLLEVLSPLEIILIYSSITVLYNMVWCALTLNMLNVRKLVVGVVIAGHVMMLLLSVAKLS